MGLSSNMPLYAVANEPISLFSLTDRAAEDEKKSEEEIMHHNDDHMASILSHLVSHHTGLLQLIFFNCLQKLCG
jgi:hypothetical protein